MDNIIFREKNKEDFQKYWNEYLELHDASPYYLLTALDYFLAYSAERQKADKSFVYLKGGKPVGCVFLPIEETAGERSISIGGGFTLAPIFQSQKNLENEIIIEIDRIARAFGVSKIMFRIDPLLSEGNPYNFLLNHDYLGAPLLGYLVDCQNVSLRRNHERAIRKISADKNFEIFIMDADSAEYGIHEQYRQLHHKAAGKVTRNKETFDLQFQMLQEGKAILVGLKYQGRFIAFTYFTFFKQGSISFSAADDPEFDELPLYHIINAKALDYLKGKGVRHMDMGQPLTTSHQLFYHPDEKQKNIALFKTGFGGRFVENFRGIKYFSKPVFKQDQESFIKEYEKTVIE